uniref:Putative ovule protein n=1 Tax=Solanum chacoense TaxID=4108 RepID=A0A0V0HBG6_SOLCH
MLHLTRHPLSFLHQSLMPPTAHRPPLKTSISKRFALSSCPILKFALWWSLHLRSISGEHPSILAPFAKYADRQTPPSPTVCSPLLSSCS